MGRQEPIVPHTVGTKGASRALRAHLTPEIGPPVTVSGGAVVVMTIRVMSSGKGYEYLLKSVVVGDGDREMSSPLTRYYTESGCPPGTWVGTGLTSLDDGRTPALTEGDTVTEEHLARLLGEGIHPITGDKLGKRFPSLQPPRERIAARIARLDPDLRGEGRAEAEQRIRGEEVAKQPRTAVAGFDLTFSPPKSVSATGAWPTRARKP